MTHHKLKIAAAIALSLSTGIACATDITQIQAGGAIYLVTAKSVAAGLKTAGGGTVTSTVAAPTTGVKSLQLNDTIVITVTGAKFDRSALAAVPVTLTNSAVASWVLDLATDTILTGTVTTAATSNDTLNTMVLTAKYDLTGVAAGTDVTLNTVVKRDVLGLATDVHKAASGIADIKDLSVTPALHKFAFVGTEDETATVASSFLNLDNSGTPTAILTIPNTVLKVSTLDDTPASGTDSKGTMLVKLTGVPANATKITWVAAGLGQITADGVTAPATATPGGSHFFLAGGGKAYGLISDAVTKAPITATAMVITMDGTTAILPTEVKMSIDYQDGVSDAYIDHVLLSETVIAKITRDGSSFTLNSSSNTNIVKISDTSGSISASSGKISIMAFDNAGTSIAGVGGLTIPNLTSNGTVKVLISEVKTEYPLATRFDFSVESESVVVSNVKKTDKGINVTISGQGGSNGL